MRQFTPKTLFFCALCFISGTVVYSQEQLPPAANYTTQLHRPSIEIGAGVLSYFGDVGHLNGTTQYSQLNWGYNITMRNPVSEAFSLDFNAFFGKIRHQENLPGQMINFESAVKMGSASISYNFNDILPKQRNINPYLSVGFGTMEFNPKTDLKDADGNYYHLWSNGSLMSLPEKDGKSDEATTIYRDYNYESDWRELQGGSGAFPLRTLVIPVAAGASINVNDKWNVNLGASYMFAFSDNLDGINAETAGVSGVNKANDALLYSSLGIAYNLHHTVKKNTKLHENNDDYFPGIDLDDEDGDGVVDAGDECPLTPEGVVVDKLGCPIDTDGDGIADHIDEEINSDAGVPVSLVGVALTDEDLMKMYLIYSDPSGNPHYLKSQTYTDSIDKLKNTSRKKGYRIEVIDSENLSPEEIARLLSVPDIKAIETLEGMDFYIDNVDSKYEAVQKFLKLNQLNIPARILQPDGEGYFELSASEIEHAAIFNDEENSDAIVFRVQLGAFKYKLSRNVFKDVRDLIVLQGNDGLTRYVSGSYSNIQEAAEHKVNLLLKGYEGAFVTAYQNGKRITLKEAGATVDKSEDITPQASGKINPNLIKYSVKLGTFAGRVPAETLGKYMSLGNVRPIRNTEGETTYVYGSFNSMDDAEKGLSELRTNGFTDAQMVGEFNGKIISAREAQTMRGDN